MSRFSRGIKSIIAILAIIGISILIIILISLKNRPDSSDILAYVEHVYKKDFQIVNEFTYIAHTDGEVEAQRELECPAVELQDRENSDIRFMAYAYPIEGEESWLDWVYRDNYSQKTLIYCMKQQQLEMNNEDECEALDSFGTPCLVLDNTDETAQKLQNMVIQFNELYQYDDTYSSSYISGCENFEVEGSMFVYSIEAGNISDRWLDETGPFCYDTPIEKYKAFLNELKEPLEKTDEVSEKITDDMLNACNTYPSSDSYWNDSLILLNQSDENVRLYGLSAGEQTAMLLYIRGEKVLIEYPFPTFRNFYEELPKLSVYDVDGDGEDEVIISLRTYTGSIRRYALWVCDYEQIWNVYLYEDYLQDIEDTIHYSYEEKNRTIAFLDNSENVLWEKELPDWADTYMGVVNFEDDMGFDAETMQMDVIPRIKLEDSLPYEPVSIIFNIRFDNGNFEIDGYDISELDEDGK